MAREKATTKSTGGGGFTFADKVAAAFLARMLRRDLVLGADVGPIAEIDFETRESGNLLDDLEITFRREQLATHLLVSVKSNRQLTKAGFNSEFVADAWEQWQGAHARRPFDPEHDLLGLAVGAIDDQALDEWKIIHQQAIDSTPQRFLDRLVPESQSNSTQRAIFESLRATVTEAKRDALETARLAGRLRVIPFSEKDENEAINLCTEIVAHGSLPEAQNLWGRLLQIAAESRGTGAHLDLPIVVRKLRPDFDLRDYPDFQADWQKLEAISRENIENEVRTSLGAGVHLSRTGTQADVVAEIEKNNVTVVIGESGSGKSSLISEIVKPGGKYRRTLWLTAGQLSKPSQIEIAKMLNLRHALPELIAGSGVRDSVLVVDGFEQFEGDARKNVNRLVKELREQEFENWKVIFTCQPQTLDAVRDALIESGVTDFGRVDFEKPKLEEVLAAVQNVSAVLPLLMRKELQPILRNLMILDWVIREEVAHRIPASQPWIGETEIIDLIWARWIGSDSKKFARDGLLRLLGQEEGERLTGAVHIDAVPLDQLELLGELVEKGLVRTDGGSVRFYHDLMGDWARYRALKFAGTDAAARIRTLVKAPRWGRAIRLYAQSLAEEGAGLERWRALAAELPGEDPDSVLAGDFLLDALLFAPNSEALLEQVWSDLIADKGETLKRLLQRLLHVASIPDWRFQGIEDTKLAERSEAWFRIPHPLYWYPVLRVLRRHSQDIVEFVPRLGAEVCALWLRTMPVGTFGRDEASHLALDIAKKLQGQIAAGRHLDKKTQVVFEALLYAAPDRPDEVQQMALELSGRRPEPSYAVEWAIEEQERQDLRLEEWKQKHPEADSGRRVQVPGTTSYRLTRFVPPEPQGPQRDVPDSFRSAVLNSPALNGLMSVRPEAAKEVLLAVSIHEPREISRHIGMEQMLGEELGLSDWPDGSPALPWKGSFLRFLETSPEQGLDAIVQLVNYATSKWLQSEFGASPTEKQRRGSSLAFDVGDKTVLWTGDGNVFGWNRSFIRKAAQVECALMALEQWLDNEIQAGRGIERWVQYVFDHGQSIAFAGVLVSVGLKYPALFARELRPLLGNFYLYDWQQAIAASEQQEIWAFSLFLQPPEVAASAVKWHRHRHRRCRLRDIAVWLMHQHLGTRDYLAERKTAWAKEVQAEGKDKVDLEFFLARFDPSNYTETPTEDGCVEIAMKWPPHLQVIADRSQNETELKLLAMGMAMRARRLLDGREVLKEEQLPEFVSQLRQLASWKFPAAQESQDHYRISSIAGALAVLVVQHRSWLKRDSDLEKWVLDTLRTLHLVLPEHHSPRASTDHSAESFLGEAGVALLLESTEEWVYRLAFEGVTAAAHNATLYTMWRAYQLREQLGDTFVELVNVVVLWSALRRAGTREAGPYADTAALAKQKPALFARFIGGRLKIRIPLSAAERLGRGLAERIEPRVTPPKQREWQRLREEERANDEHEVYRDMPDLDIEVLHAGFAFLQAAFTGPVPASSLASELLNELFDLEMRTFPAPNPEKGFRELRGTPYDFDNWVMRLAAAYIAHANSPEIARRFYRPVLDQGPRARYWVDDFLGAWVTNGLPSATDRHGYARIWKEMIDYVRPLPDWQPGKVGYWCPAEILAPYLVGIHEAQVSILGKGEYRSVVAAMAATLQGWGDRWLGYPSIAQWYANFLTTDSGEVLLAQGIRQLATAMNSFDEEGWNRYDLGSLLTGTLSLAWTKLRKEIEVITDLRQAFLEILTALCARQVPEALNLRNKVTDALSVPSGG